MRPLDRPAATVDDRPQERDRGDRQQDPGREREAVDEHASSPVAARPVGSLNESQEVTVSSTAFACPVTWSTRIASAITSPAPRPRANRHQRQQRTLGTGSIADPVDQQRQQADRRNRPGDRVTEDDQLEDQRRAEDGDRDVPRDLLASRQSDRQGEQGHGGNERVLPVEGGRIDRQDRARRFDEDAADAERGQQGDDGGDGRRARRQPPQRFPARSTVRDGRGERAAPSAVHARVPVLLPPHPPPIGTPSWSCLCAIIGRTIGSVVRTTLHECAFVIGKMAAGTPLVSRVLAKEASCCP